jgi:adenine-specific DNA methylase
MVESKQCRHCGVEKPASEFYPAIRNRDGLHSYCKPCNLARTREWVKRHPVKRALWGRRWRTENAERVRKNIQAWRAANPEKVRAQRVRAGQSGVVLPKVITTVCPTCGQEFTYERNGKPRTFCSVRCKWKEMDRRKRVRAGQASGGTVGEGA